MEGSELARRRRDAPARARRSRQSLRRTALDPAVDPLRDGARCEALLAAARDLRHRDPERMVLLARTAAELAGCLPPERCGGEPLHQDLLARAWAEVANAHRVANELRAAARCFSRAFDHLRQGSGDPFLLAHLMDLDASLLRAQRRFREAAALLERARALYDTGGERRLAGRALLGKALAVGADGEHEEALRLLVAALDRFDRGDLELVAAAVHGIIDFTVKLHRFAEGRRLLEISRPLYAGAGELNLLKLRWVEGRLAAGLGEAGAAERAFGDVRSGFEHHRMPYEAALVSLDLAAVWLEQGRTEEVRAAIVDTLAAFRALGIRREALAALLVLHRALARERASLRLLRTVAARLQRFPPAA
jgi:tetratricopeptide (TPR) repeat protein